jgi:hypothetical protein
VVVQPPPQSEVQTQSSPSWTTVIVPGTETYGKTWRQDTVDKAVEAPKIHELTEFNLADALKLPMTPVRESPPDPKKKKVWATCVCGEDITTEPVRTQITDTGSKLVFNCPYCGEVGIPIGIPIKKL